MRRSRAIAVVVLAATAVAAHGDKAAAGQYDVLTCAADRVNNSSKAFGEFVTRGMRIRRACNLEGPGLRGLVTGNVPRPGRVARGARSIAVLRAPVGTVIKTVRWSGGDRRRDCAYAAEVYGVGPSGAKPIHIRRAGQKCPRPRRAQDSYSRRKTYDVSGSTSLVQRLVCRGLRKRRWCSARGNNYVRTLVAQVTLEDTLGPTVGITGGGLASGRWVRGSQSVIFDAHDNIGIERQRLLVGGTEAEANARQCDAASAIPCPNGSGLLRFDSERVPDGTHPFAIEVFDRAGHSGRATGVAFVDNNPPERVDAVVDGGDAWRRNNNFTIKWASSPEAHAPVVAAHYRLCSLVGGRCETASRNGPAISRIDRISVPGPGEWTVAVWRQDSAGNQDPRLASVPVRLRFDPDPPRLAFEQTNLGDPTRLSVVATDATSGLAGGQIELSREGSGSWQGLATHREGNRLVARIDDAQLAPGRYLARVHAADNAGNQATTDRRADGAPVVLDLPLRTPTAVSAEIAHPVIVRRVVRGKGRHRLIRRRLTRTSPRARAMLGQRVAVVGRLTAAGGRALGSAPIRLLDSNAGGSVLAEAHTDANGRYRFDLRADRSRKFTIGFPGNGVALPSSAEASLAVPAQTSFRVSRKTVLNGQGVRFRGRLQSMPVPSRGKLVEVQVRLSARWQTFRTTRTDMSGRWWTSYRFLRTVGFQRYAFRVHLPEEVGYPFTRGKSRPLVVKVRGL